MSKKVNVIMILEVTDDLTEEQVEHGIKSTLETEFFVSTQPTANVLDVIFVEVKNATN